MIGIFAICLKYASYFLLENHIGGAFLGPARGLLDVINELADPLITGSTLLYLLSPNLNPFLLVLLAHPCGHLGQRQQKGGAGRLCLVSQARGSVGGFSFRRFSSFSLAEG